MSCSLRLTPQLGLKWLGHDAQWVALEKGFASDWRQGLLMLGAHTGSLAAAPSLLFWHSLAKRYLQALCQLPEGERVPPPTSAELQATALAAPVMEGGEYLNQEALLRLWQELEEWVRQAVEQCQGLDAFLLRWAPDWRQVGRVYFHLAENKNNSVRPFAFLSTYTTGLSQSGKLKHLPLRTSLEQYAGERNQQALVKLLSPIQRAAENCPWVQTMLKSGEIYSALSWPVDRAYQFLQSVPQLEASGLSVLLPNWWKRRPRPRVSVQVGPSAGSPVGVNALMAFDVAVALGEETLTQRELAQLLAGGDGLVMLKGQWVEVDRQRLQEALEHWKGLQKQARNGEISFLQGMRLLAGASLDLKGQEHHQQERPWVALQASQELARVLAGLRQPEQLADLDPGPQLQARLREYQRTGLKWMHFLTQLGLGACLADDMGLGKTIQVLALLLCQKRQGPNLLVVPASLLGNWRAEAQKFAPSLRLLFCHPAEADADTLAQLEQDAPAAVAQADLVVTTYSLLSRQPWLEQVHWHTLILDEAQAIKNTSTRQSQAVKKLRSHARLALTGTPVENRLGDLWSLFDFLNPGLLGSATAFSQFVKALQNQLTPLRQLVGPYILRRLKTDRRILNDLPDKIETSTYCGLTKAQVKPYQRVLKHLEQALQSREGIERRGLVLQTLMQLKQVCNHPSQLSGDGEFLPSHSGKFLRLGEICQELAERQERVLIFTQFREIIDPLAEYLQEIFAAPGLVLHGGTRVAQRQKLVEQFQREDGPPFFLLSLKAGGTGLTLTRASHVVHFDRWWNPAVENQATDRAFRIGQKNNVQVHKFITRGTLEERIDALIASKQKMSDELLQGDQEINLTELSDDQLLKLVQLDLSQVVA